MAVLVPRRPAPETTPADEIRVFREPRFRRVIAVTALGSSGFSVVSGYIEPFPTAAIAGLLVVLGLGGLLGNLLAGRATDRGPARVIRVSYAAGTVLSALMPFVTTWRPAAVVVVFALGVAMAAVIPPLQGMILNLAGKQSTMAVTVNVAAFLVGHAIGASFGGLLIELTSVRWTGASAPYSAPPGSARRSPPSRVAVCSRRLRRHSPQCDPNRRASWRQRFRANECPAVLCFLIGT